jgi:hypothetical protein
MSKTLMKAERRDVKSRIEKMLAGDDILLSAEENKILARWEMADQLLSAKDLTWNEIRERLCNEFGVGRHTAELDISSAQEIFGRSKRISKRYLIHLHLDRMDRDIEKIRKGLFTRPVDGVEGITQSRQPDEKEIIALAKIYDAYTKALCAIPEDINKNTLPPPVLMFNLPAGTTITPAMNFDKAMQLADEILYENIPNDDADTTDAGN